MVCFYLFNIKPGRQNDHWSTTIYIWPEFKLLYNPIMQISKCFSNVEATWQIFIIFEWKLFYLITISIVSTHSNHDFIIVEQTVWIIAVSPPIIIDRLFVIKWRSKRLMDFKHISNKSGLLLFGSWVWFLSTAMRRIKTNKDWMGHPEYFSGITAESKD